jgi:hypothetical protein
VAIIDHTAPATRGAALIEYSAAMSRAALAQARAHEANTPASWRAYRARMMELDNALKTLQETI